MASSTWIMFLRNISLVFSNWDSVLSFRFAESNTHTRQVLINPSYQPGFNRFFYFTKSIRQGQSGFNNHNLNLPFLNHPKKKKKAHPPIRMWTRRGTAHRKQSDNWEWKENQMLYNITMTWTISVIITEEREWCFPIQEVAPHANKRKGAAYMGKLKGHNKINKQQLIHITAQKIYRDLKWLNGDGASNEKKK